MSELSCLINLKNLSRSLKRVKMNKINKINKINKFHALKKGIEFIELFDEFMFEVDVEECVLMVKCITTNFVVYNKDTFIQFTNKNDLIYWFLNKICLNSINLITNYNSNFIYKSRPDVYISVKIIQKSYRKYRLRTARIRNDLVIRGLTEYFFHPSRLTFEI